MAMIAVPFGFLVGNRGAMAGIGVSLAIGIAYRGSASCSRKSATRICCRRPWPPSRPT